MIERPPRRGVDPGNRGDNPETEGTTSSGRALAAHKHQSFFEVRSDHKPNRTIRKRVPPRGTGQTDNHRMHRYRISTPLICMMVRCGASSWNEPGATPGPGKRVMTLRTLLAALVSMQAIGSAIADERIDFTPPLYREQARPTAAVRQAAEMTTTPSLVGTSDEAPRPIVEATAR